MRNNNISTNRDIDDRIDAREVLAGVRKRKLIVLTSGLLTAAITYYYLEHSTPLYQSEAIVKIDGARQSSTPGEVASLLGLQQTATAEQAIDRILGRDFLLKTAVTLNLQRDNFFIGEEFPAAGLQRVAAEVRRTVFGDPQPPSHPVEDAVVSKLRETVTITVTKGDSLVISSLHPQPGVAADISNAFATQLIASIQDDNARHYRDQRNYLAGILQEAQADVDQKKRNLANATGRTDEFSRFRLQQESRVAEAVYNTMVESVQAEMVISGFQGDVGTIYQTATPSSRPSHPKQLLGTIGGLVGGTLLGLLVALLTTIWSNRIFSKAAIAAALNATIDIYAPRLSTRRLPIWLLLRRSRGASSAWRSELLWALKTRNKPITIVVPSGGSISTALPAIVAGQLLSESGHRTAVLLLDRAAQSGQAIREPHDHSPLDTTFSLVDRRHDLNVFTLNTVGDIVDSHTVEALLAATSGEGSYDSIVIAATSANASALTMALPPETRATVVITKPGVSTRDGIDRAAKLDSSLINIGT